MKSGRDLPFEVAILQVCKNAMPGLVRLMCLGRGVGAIRSFLRLLVLSSCDSLLSAKTIYLLSSLVLDCFIIGTGGAT